MKKLIAILLLCLFTGSVFANTDEEVAPISLYGTVGGYGILYSVGGQYLVTKNFGLNLSYTSYEVSVDEDDSGFNLYEDKLEITLAPIFASFYFGSENHRFFMEVGANIVRVQGRTEDFFIEGIHDAVLPIAGFGYNYHNMNGGFFFKIGMNFIVFEDDILPWSGISIGVTF